MNPREALEGLLLEEQARGFFSEFYVESGRLDIPAPAFSFGNSNSVFDLASLTKALLTGPLIHGLANRNGFSLATPIANVLSAPFLEAFSSEQRSLTFQDLLSHRSGLAAWRNFWMGHLNEGPLPSAVLTNPIIPEVFARMAKPGSKDDLYSDLGYILLGFVAEALERKSLAALWSEYLKLQHSPIAATSIGFSHQIAAKPEDFVPSAFCAIRERMLQGEVHDENSAALGGVSGHAGLFASGSHLSSYLKSLFHSKEGLAYLRANERELKAHSFEGLSGLRRGNGTSAALFAEGKGMGHLGFTGTAFWLDLSSRRYAIFLSNRVVSGRVNPHITAVRRKVFGYLDELA